MSCKILQSNAATRSSCTFQNDGQLVSYRLPRSYHQNIVGAQPCEVPFKARLKQLQIFKPGQQVNSIFLVCFFPVQHK